MKKKELKIEWTNKVEVWKENGVIVARPAVWVGTDQDGKKVRVYITKIEDIEEHEW